MKLAVAAATVLFLCIVILFGWILNDLRLELKRSAATVNRDLPVILTNTRKTTETLAEVSSDIKDLRNLAGVEDVPRDSTLVTYADELLDLIEAQDAAVIGTEQVIGKQLSDPLPAAEWVAGARKEAVWLTFRVKSRQELLKRITETKFGSKWRIRVGDNDPLPLRDWLIANHPATAELTSEPAAAPP